MSVLAGIDEVGYGPLLGPMVVGMSVFRMERALLNANHWELLGRSVCRTRRNHKGRLLVCDSKKAYSRSSGIKHLERTALSVLSVLGHYPENLYELVSSLAVDCYGRFGEYPWYEGMKEVVLDEGKSDKHIAGEVFKNDLEKNGLEFLGMRAKCLDVRYYNGLVSKIRNKSNVLFMSIAELMNKAFEEYGEDDLHIIIDRQGGRSRYGQVLMRSFVSMELTVLKENSKVSSYELRSGGRAMKVHFVVGADGAYLPVSLSSMVSKYIREMMMGCVNRYFTKSYPGIKGTAGYWQDGVRFVGELEKNGVYDSKIKDMLVRLK